MESALRGDHRAFAELVERYKCLVCSVAYEITCSLTKSEEVGQEAFVLAWAQLKELREPHRFRNWICGIARNLSFRTQRDERRRPIAGSRLERQNRDVPSADPSPLDRIISREEESAVAGALGLIPEPYRLAIILFYREQHSLRKVAELLDITENSVKQRLFRGRRLLQEQALAMIDSTLSQTRPARAFNAAVMALIAAGAVIAPGAAAAAQAARLGKAGATIGKAALAKALVVGGTALVLAMTTTAVAAWHRRQNESATVHKTIVTSSLAATARSLQESIAAAGTAESDTPAPRGAGAAPTAPQEKEVFSTDFEEPSGAPVHLGLVVSGSVCGQSEHCAQGGLNLKGPRHNSVSVGSHDLSPDPRIYTFNDHQMMSFDYWLGGDEGCLELMVRDMDQNQNFGFNLCDVVRKRWAHAVAQVEEFFPGRFHDRHLDNGDGIKSVTVSALRAGGRPLYIDNLKITEYAVGPLPRSTANAPIRW